MALFFIFYFSLFLFLLTFFSFPFLCYLSYYPS